MSQDELNDRLIEAIQSNDNERIHTWLDKGADANATGGAKNYSALAHAVLHLNKQAILALLQHGADINANPTKTGCPLELALSQHSDTDLPEFLVEHGADPFHKNHKANTQSAIDFLNNTYRAMQSSAVGFAMGASEALLHNRQLHDKLVKARLKYIEFQSKKHSDRIKRRSLRKRILVKAPSVNG